MNPYVNTASPYASSAAALSRANLSAQVYDRHRDPPGQRSVYIPPGDTYKESYRLSTYRKFPTETRANPRLLAQNGFTYSGYKDRVKCFSCGRCVEKLESANHLSPFQDWHKQDCDFKNGTDTENQPLGLWPRAVTVTNPNTTVQVPVPRNNIPVPSAAIGNEPARQSAQTRTQTARIVTTGVRYHPPEFATIVSAHHEQLVRSLDLRKEADRLKTYSNWPTANYTVHRSHLAKSGFFYLGNLDRTQCFSCGGVLRSWEFGDSVHDEHRRHFPECGMVLSNEDRNVPLDPREREHVPSPQPQTAPPDSSESEQRNLDVMFPCHYPVSPHMRNEDARFETFDYRWPGGRVNATPQQIANAGFFFLGERDRVKCWYCNGGLQNWNPTDEPWQEHAKWYPTCEFLLRSKGPDFAHLIVSIFPNLTRPVLRGGPFDVSPNASRVRPNVQPPLSIIDPAVERRKKAEMERGLKTALNSVQNRIEEIIPSFEPDRAAKCIVERYGDSQQEPINNIIREPTNTNAFQWLLDIGDSDFCKSVDNKCSEHQSDESQSVSEQENSASNSVVTVPSNLTATFEEMESLPEGTSPSMAARIQNLKEERLCKICLDKSADIVFVPCGHLVSCIDCAQALRKCPMCRGKIDKAIRTYMS
ncbi:RING-HC finger protein [Endozoicomonas ascidiicola]|uniref:RING-HC finger protein n=1 Tax=Endozoicomonas ascidiicola TaxID=1698521 RepID=UPI000B025E5E|nr:RING-HC finger protein [Endozoicomonas ascidiicola]